MANCIALSLNLFPRKRSFLVAFTILSTSIARFSSLPRLSKRALEQDPLDWFKINKKKEGDVVTTRIHEVLKTGVKVSLDQDKKLIFTIKKIDLAKDAADARPEVFSPGNALDAKITELDLNLRKVKLSVKAAQIDEEKSLIAKFGEGATKSGATLKGIFEKAIGKKAKKEK